MMVQHPDMRTPNPDDQLWRYMSFAKCFSLIDSRSLFFPRVDKLDDKFEGAYPKATSDEMKKYVTPPGVAVADFVLWMRHNVYVNCWHHNTYESHAMWNVYLPAGEGVAIQSTYERLERSFRSWPDPLFASKVTYIDHTTDSFPSNNFLYPFLHKAKSFSHENEIRLIYWHGAAEAARMTRENRLPAPGVPLPFFPGPENGVSIVVDLDALIDRVIVAPKSQPWFASLVKRLLLK
jgi:hypothetical protein